MWIANIGFERPDAPEGHRWKTFGGIWYERERHRCSIRLRGFRFGAAVGKPFASVKIPPYLDGDIVYHTGDYASPSGVRRDYLPVGHILTTEEGTYMVVLYCMPYPKPPSENERSRAGIFCDVFLSDAEASQSQHAAPETTGGDDEVPF